MMFGFIIGFICLIWALASLLEAHSGVGRIFQELEYERQAGQMQPRPGEDI